MTPGEAIREYRWRSDLSQENLAKLLGVSRLTVWRWETDARQVGRKIMPKLMKVSGIPAAVLRPDWARVLEGKRA